MSCRMITTVIKCQQPSILPLSLFFSYLDVWGAATSRWEGGRLQVQTVSGTGPDPIFFLSLQAVENPRSLRVHEVTTSQIPAAWQWTTMPDMLGKMPQCHATFQIWYIYIYTYICIILSCILSCILSYWLNITKQPKRPRLKFKRALQPPLCIKTRVPGLIRKKHTWLIFGTGNQLSLLFCDIWTFINEIICGICSIIFSSKVSRSGARACYNAYR